MTGGWAASVTYCGGEDGAASGRGVANRLQAFGPDVVA